MGFFYLFVLLRYQSVGLGADIPHLSALMGGGSPPKSFPLRARGQGELSKKTGKIPRGVFPTRPTSHLFHSVILHSGGNPNESESVC